MERMFKDMIGERGAGFWAGALVGAGAVLLLTNPQVKEAVSGLFGRLTPARRSEPEAAPEAAPEPHAKNSAPKKPRTAKSRAATSRATKAPAAEA